MEYHVSMVARVRDQCYLGARPAEIADLLGVSLGTLDQWRLRYPDFDHAWRSGTEHANAKVAAALFKRACGYEVEITKTTKDGVFTETKHMPPDVSACIFWLTNRRGDLWSRGEQVEVGKDKPATESISDIEAARRIAFALTSAMRVTAENPRSDENGRNRTPTPQT